MAQINRDAANGCLFKFCHRRREMPNDACDDNDDRATRESRCCRLWLLQCRAQGKRKGFPRPTLHPGMPGRPAPPPSFGKTGATSQSARLLQASLAGRAPAPRDTLFFELGWSPPQRLCAGGFASDPTTRTDRQRPQVLTALLLGAHKTRHATGSQFRFRCRRSRLTTNNGTNAQGHDLAAFACLLATTSATTSSSSFWPSSLENSGSSSPPGSGLQPR